MTTTMFSNSVKLNSFPKSWPLSTNVLFQQQRAVLAHERHQMYYQLKMGKGGFGAVALAS